MAKRKRGPGPRLNIKGRAKKRAFTALDQFKIFASELLASSDFQAFTHIGTTLEHLSNLLSQLHQALQQPHSISKTLSRSIHDTITQANEPSRISNKASSDPSKAILTIQLDADINSTASRAHAHLKDLSDIIPMPNNDPIHPDSDAESDDPIQRTTRHAELDRVLGKPLLDHCRNDLPMKQLPERSLIRPSQFPHPYATKVLSRQPTTTGEPSMTPSSVEALQDESGRQESASMDTLASGLISYGQYRCPLCLLVFQMTKSLQKHYTRTHKGSTVPWSQRNHKDYTIKPSRFSCSVCDHSYESNDSLRCHLLGVHGKSWADYMEIATRAAAPPNSTNTLEMPVEAGRQESESEAMHPCATKVLSRQPITNSMGDLYVRAQMGTNEYDDLQVALHGHQQIGDNSFWLPPIQSVDSPPRHPRKPRDCLGYNVYDVLNAFGGLITWTWGRFSGQRRRK
ncbi:MAG: hypothetical protein Q9221_008988 [Calogaya cf. arnoldii]